MSDVWTAPTNVATGEADIDLYNTDVLANIRYLDQRDRARGLVAYQRLTTGYAGRTTTGLVDMSLADVPVESGRAYLIGLNVHYIIFGGAGSWTTDLNIDTVLSHRWDFRGVGNWHIANTILYYAASTTTIDLDIRVGEFVDGSTYLMSASYDVPRMLWVEDIGPQ